MEALADISLQSSDLLGAGRWTAVCLAVGVITSDKLANMNALRRLAAICDIGGDQDTALSLLCVTLEGFKFMGVHRRIAECMVHMAEIWESREDFQLATQLLEAARPEFERATQVDKAAGIVEKLKSLRESLEEKEIALTEGKLKSLPSMGTTKLVVSSKAVERRVENLALTL
ncbi:hypothetical protein C8F04DRAFT_1262841 [Mycena alexandri]|uniref:Uncharacterized protein n=1 Tax=Mycena alexandri TaxID=1745969 RepID=A0AAD6SPY3_9AGAR|nr:hypothetical protein C8F04DRAFT_1262841 [Mycena alexandri]